MFDSVNADESDSDQSIADVNGFIGEVRRSKEKLPALTLEQVTAAIAERGEQDFLQVIRNIASIDQDNNGYVTVTELEDILKL